MLLMTINKKNTDSNLYNFVRQHSKMLSYQRISAFKMYHKVFILLESGKKETEASGEGKLERRITLENIWSYYYIIFLIQIQC